jgi:outer membrane protein TolC
MEIINRIAQNNWLRFFFALFFVFNAKIIQAQDETVYLNMEEAMSMALARNNQVKASEYGVLQARWNSKNAWTRMLPSVYLTTRYTWIDDSTFALRDFSRYFQGPNSPFGFNIPQTVFQSAFVTSIDVNMQLFNGTLFYNLFITEAQEEAAEFQDESTRRNIIFLAISTYLDVLKNEEILKLQKEYLDLSLLNYEKAERMHTAGRFSKSEALRWKVDYQQQKGIVINSENQDRSARARLCRVVNLDMRTSIKVDPQIPQRILDEGKRVAALPDEEIIKMIHIDNETLIAANAALNAARKNEDISHLVYQSSRANFMPNLSLNYSYGWRENETVNLDDYSPQILSINFSMPVNLDDYSPQILSINFSMPLFTGFQNTTTLKSNYYGYQQSQENFQDQLQNVRFILTETVNKIINLKTQLEISKVNIEYNERNYRIVEQQKEQGLVSNIDFIDAKLNLQDANLQNIKANYDFISGIIELYYLLGKINETVIR